MIPSGTERQGGIFLFLEVHFDILCALTRYGGLQVVGRCKRKLRTRLEIQAKGQVEFNHHGYSDVIKVSFVISRVVGEVGSLFREKNFRLDTEARDLNQCKCTAMVAGTIRHILRGTFMDTKFRQVKSSLQSKRKLCLAEACE